MSCSAETGGATLYRGAAQPAFRPFAIPSVGTGANRLPVNETLLDRRPFHALRHFGLAGPAGPRATVLVVPPLSGHFPILLRDVVLGLLAETDVAVLDWTNVRHVATELGGFGFEANIRAIRNAVLRLGPGIGVLALCQAGVPALAATAHLAAELPGSEPAALVLFGAPIDPLANPTPLVELIRERSAFWYRVAPLALVPPGHAGTGRRVYPAETQLAALERFLALSRETGGEVARKMERDDGSDPASFPFRDLYTSVMDLDARHYAENLERVFLSCRIARGELVFAGRPVDPGAIRRTGLMTVEGAEDVIAAPGQTGAAQALCRGIPDRDRRSLVVPGCGHFALFHGAVWRETICPAALAHIRAHAAGRRVA